MILAVSVDHPVLSVGADLQFEGSDIVRLLSFLGDGTLHGDACEHLQSIEVHLRARKEIGPFYCRHFVSVWEQAENGSMGWSPAVIRLKQLAITKQDTSEETNSLNSLLLESP